MRKLPVLLVAALLSLAAFSALANPPPVNDTQLLGFTLQGSAAERALEQRFDAPLSAADQSAWNKQMASAQNILGSAHDKANAEWVLKQFQSFGWDAHIETFHVLMPTPQERVLELVAPSRFTAALEEPAIAEDPATQTSRKDFVPPFNAYSADGDVTGELVYVNYGTPDDYRVLDRAGISVKGKIVIARYGHAWRGIKPVVAHEHGAIGAIIYSDPRDDGYWQGTPYPEGAWRSAAGVQYGSVAKMQIYPGDPSTPGYGSTSNARHLTPAQAETVLKIPVLPISYADAKPLLAALGGPVVPPEWRGALPFAYHLGPGPAKVHLKLAFNWNIVPAYDVIAKIKGSQYPDEWIVRGNHRDGWVFGSADPLSGTVAMLDEARSIGKLVKGGWQPKRSIVYASWDGEEEGLLGSTEWVETHAAELQNKAVLYLNTDDSGRGFLSMGGSQTLQAFVNQVARGIQDPETGVNLIERLRARAAVAASDDDATAQARAYAQQIASAENLPIGALGSGSDFSSFLQHLGIATLTLGFGGEGGGGSYHSLYDTWHNYNRFGNPGFVYGVTLSKSVGHTILRMADAPILPFQFSEFADTVGEYLAQVQALANTQRTHAAEHNKLLASGAFKLAADPLSKTVAPQMAAVAPQFDFTPLTDALSKLRVSAARYDAAYAKQAEAGFRLASTRQKRLNAMLRGMEQHLLQPAGLPGRPWYRHMIYAPGLYTGYGVKTLPGLREGLEEGQWSTAAGYIGVIADTLNTYSAQLDQATQTLRQ